MHFTFRNREDNGSSGEEFFENPASHYIHEIKHCLFENEAELVFLYNNLSTSSGYDNDNGYKPEYDDLIYANDFSDPIPHGWSIVLKSHDNNIFSYSEDDFLDKKAHQIDKIEAMLHFYQELYNILSLDEE